MDALKRLSKSINRILPEEDREERARTESIRILKSTPMGGAYLLRALWERIGLDKLIAKLIEDRSFSSPVEWALFAMVAYRALRPESKLSVEQWVSKDVSLGSPQPIEVQC